MEIEILNFIQTLHTPFGDVVMPLITSLGNAGVFWIILAIVLVIIPKTRKIGITVSAALVLDLIFCNILIKPLVARIRPFDINTAVELLISKPRDYSFPSGHTAASFAASSAIFVTGHRKTGVAAMILAALIGISRLYLYVHYPTDVLGGLAIGVGCGICSCFIVNHVMQKIEERKEAEKPEYQEVI